MARCIGEETALIEYGSGSSIKIEILLEHLRPAVYVPVDISRQHLLDSALRIAENHPTLDVLPVCADFTRPFDIPLGEHAGRRRTVYFPGSTLGNLTRPEALTLLRGVATLCRSGGGLLIGLDLDKDPSILVPAYNDRAGVTAAFNLNLLKRINRELGADFELSNFRHRAVYDPVGCRIEMQLINLKPQRVRIGECRFDFETDEVVVTEYSHKYTVEGFRALADDAGLDVVSVWLDPRRYFTVQYLRVR
jgi:dimethylhistidine N-methyltransferase